jgi:hypothetical protein
MSMFPVGAGDVVIRSQSREAADGHRLLTYVQVTEASDLAEAVCLSCLLLEAPDQQHLPEPAPVLVGLSWIETLWFGFGAGGGGAGH